MNATLKAHIEAKRLLVEQQWDTVLAAHTPARLREACLYSLKAGGKRLRPLMTLLASEAVGGKDADALNAALALEMIHTYSLIHDDLPAMDNDDLRRGKPTNHKVFGEGMAILAGDALLTDAFGLICSTAEHGGERAIRAAHACLELARAAGGAGMVGGQVLDIEGTGRAHTEHDLVAIHRMKTGALFVAACTMGAWLGGGTQAQVEALRGFAQPVGLGFQIIDDVLDVTADTATLGKPQGSDQAAGKVTYVDILGVDGATKRANACLDEGLARLDATFGASADGLRAIASQLIRRQT